MIRSALLGFSSVVMMTLMLMMAQPSMAGELAKFTEPQMTLDVQHRQDVCDQYDAVRNGTVELKDALQDQQLNVLMAAYGDLFVYDAVTGINDDYPGIMAVLMDELAVRGGFTWRDSFGVSYLTTNETWTELLEWGFNSYDIVGDYWIQSIERMNMGAAYVAPWYDASIVLLTIQSRDSAEEAFYDIYNWTLPYDTMVWALTLVTIVMSGLVYQVIEWLADDRDNRNLWEWTQENMYMSFLNSTQAYEYQPKTLAGRLFGVSMALWALLMTATYTANLASLLVDRSQPQLLVESVEEVAVYGLKLCVWEDTYTHEYLKQAYSTLNLIPKKTQKETYDALQTGECRYLVDSITSWERLRGEREINPKCNLERVRDPHYTVDNRWSSFVTNADSGYLCSSLIRAVLSIHMEGMREDGFIDHAWAEQMRHSHDMNCDLYDPDMPLPSAAPSERPSPSWAPSVATADELSLSPSATTTTTTTASSAVPTNSQTRGRQLSSKTTIEKNVPRRRLKAGSTSVGPAISTSSEEADDAENQQLKVEQMFGTFFFHWVLMAVSVALALCNVAFNKYCKDNLQRHGGVSAQPVKLERFEDEAAPEQHPEQAAATTLEKKSSTPAVASDELSQLRAEIAQLRTGQELFQRRMMLEQRRTMEEYLFMIMDERKRMQHDVQSRMDALETQGF